MELNEHTKAQAAHHLTEMVGSAIGVTLLSADDYPTTKQRLIDAINGFPVEMRDALEPQQKTDILVENTRQVRWHARELHRIIRPLQEAQEARVPETTPDDLGAPEEDQEAAQDAPPPAV